MSLKDWVNTINTVSVSSLNNQLVYTLVVVSMSVIAEIGMMADKAWGLDLAKFILGTAIAKSAVTAASRYGKSKTSAKLVEAQERGKATAMEQAKPQTVVHAEDQSHVKVDASNP